MPKVKYAKRKESKQSNGKLSLHPLSFGDAVKGLLETKLSREQKGSDRADGNKG